MRRPETPEANNYSENITLDSATNFLSVVYSDTLTTPRTVDITHHTDGEIAYTLRRTAVTAGFLLRKQFILSCVCLQTNADCT